MAQAKPTTTTTTTPAPLALNLGSRLKEFVLGPQREFRENAFSRIPESNAQYDSMNPLAAFMGERWRDGEGRKREVKGRREGEKEGEREEERGREREKKERGWERKK